MTPTACVQPSAPMGRIAIILIACSALYACKSGPHPALKPASQYLKCSQSALKVHEIYPQKVRVEGCGKEAIYVDACKGYGADEKCEWARYGGE